MAKLVIDGKRTDAPAGATVLEAARKLGIAIPTLCHRDGLPIHTACMLCVVRDVGTGRLVPSCSLPAKDGAEFASEAADVREARRRTLELLLAEHVGDCEAPCRRSCPAQMNIPLMIRQIAAGKTADALVTVKKDIALPAVLGRICTAPCEKACRRGRRDQPVAICLLKRFVADVDLAGSTPWRPACKPATGKRVAIVGAGPAGLAAAWHLAQEGHSCTVFDDRDQPGGALRTAVPEERLPRDVLDREIALIRSLGVEFRLSCRVGRNYPAGELEIDFDAAILATGPVDAAGRELAAHLGLKTTDRGIAVDGESFQTAKPGIFAGGNAVHAGRMAVRAVADGKDMAAAVHLFLSGRPVALPARRFNSLLGKIEEAEIQEFMKGAEADRRTEPAGGPAAGFSAAEALREARRCMHCDCRKAEECRLRLLADQYAAKQSRFRVQERPRFERVWQPAGVVYEPGKCIKCGICVRIGENRKERLGLTFIGRGFSVRVGVPFSRPLSEALEKTAAECVAACPTGALARADA